MRIVTRFIDVDELPTDLGERLTALRRLYGFRKVDVAAAVERTPLTVHRWERGDSIPRRRNIQRLAQVYGVPVDVLVPDNRSTAIS